MTEFDANRAVELPVSKSIGARFLAATFFAGTLPADPYFDDNEDLLLLQQALLSIYSDEEPIDYGETPIDVGASGTALRFVTAICASTPGADFMIMGTPRLHVRPMQPLIEVLRKAGARIEPQGPGGTGPYRITGSELEGGEFSIRGDISSQFVSALMLVSPSWKKGMKLFFTTSLASKPYIEMTASIMRKFGLKVELTDDYVKVESGKYVEPSGFRVEADWSSASFFYEAAALVSYKIYIKDLLIPGKSEQGDAVSADLFRILGVTSDFVDEGDIVYGGKNMEGKIEKDLRNNPDIVLPLAVSCLGKNVKFRLTGVANLRVKESDRLDALKESAEKIGFRIFVGDDFVEWNGERCSYNGIPLIDPHEDHRVAMAFAMAAFMTGSVRIKNPDVVEKSFINFWQQLPKVGLECELNNNIMIVRKV